MGDTIFETIHGSWLYGMGHDASDMDMFCVTDARGNKGRQTVVNGVDRVAMPLDAFLRHIREGSHQSIEALFSPQKVWNPEYDYYRAMFDSYRVTGSAVFSAYRRTITSFSYGDYKKRKHAVRLRGNLAGLQDCGRFNPIMSRSDIARAEYLARHYEGDELRYLLLENWK